MSDRAYEQMVIGVATRKYARSLEPLPAELAEGERSTSKSTVRIPRIVITRIAAS